VRSDVRLQRYTMQGPVISACPNPSRRSLPFLGHTQAALLTKAWEILQPDAQRTSMCQRGPLAGFVCHRLVHRRYQLSLLVEPGRCLGSGHPSDFKSSCFAKVMRTAFFSASSLRSRRQEADSMLRLDDNTSSASTGDTTGVACRCRQGTCILDGRMSGLCARLVSSTV
jgi:hypothetical protein